MAETSLFGESYSSSIFFCPLHAKMTFFELILDICDCPITKFKKASGVGVDLRLTLFLHAFIKNS